MRKLGRSCVQSEIRAPLPRDGERRKTRCERSAMSIHARVRDWTSDALYTGCLEHGRNRTTLVQAQCANSARLQKCRHAVLRRCRLALGLLAAPGGAALKKPARTSARKWSCVGFTVLESTAFIAGTSSATWLNLPRRVQELHHRRYREAKQPCDGHNTTPL